MPEKRSTKVPKRTFGHKDKEPLPEFCCGTCANWRHTEGDEFGVCVKAAVTTKRQPRGPESGSILTIETARGLWVPWEYMPVKPWFLACSMFKQRTEELKPSRPQTTPLTDLVKSKSREPVDQLDLFTLETETKPQDPRNSERALSRGGRMRDVPITGYYIPCPICGETKTKGLPCPNVDGHVLTRQKVV